MKKSSILSTQVFYLKTRSWNILALFKRITLSIEIDMVSGLTFDEKYHLFKNVLLIFSLLSNIKLTTPLSS